MLGCHSGTLVFNDSSNWQVGFGAQLGFDEAAERSYRDYYAAINPYWGRPEIYARPGDVNTREMAIDTPAMLKTEFYNDFGRNLKLYDFFGATCFNQGSRYGMLTLFRSADQPQCGEPEEMELMRQLVPHFIRSIELQNRILGLQNQCNAFSSVLDRMNQAVMLLDTAGRVIFLNQSAQTISDRKDGLKISEGKLSARSASENGVLRKMIHDAGMAAWGRKAEQPGGNLLISRSSLEHSYRLTIAPVRPNVIAGLEEPAVAVFISDPMADIRTPIEDLQNIFGLTPAEARLSQMLTRGKGLREAAEEIGVSYNTVRTQIRSVLAKTGTRRQTELMRVLSVTGSTLTDGAFANGD